MDRLANPAQVRAFAWQPCNNVAGCEQMALLPFLQGQYPRGVVQEEAGQTRVIFSGGSLQYWMVMFADESGWLIDAYRAPAGPPNYCLPFAGAARGASGGMLIEAQTNLPPGKLGGLVHTFGDPSDPIAFNVTLPWGYGPAGSSNTPMAASRWAWNCAPDRVLSVATADASDLRVVAQGQGWDPTSSILSINSIDTNGSNFLLGEAYETADGGVTGILAATDGKNPQTTYLAPTDGSFYDYPVYSGPYVAWLRGIGLQAVNLFTKIEVWASLYDPDPTKLVPFKVDDYQFVNMATMLGGAGRIAFQAYGPPTTVAVYDLASKQRASLTLPDAHEVSLYMGLTSKYLYLAGAPSPWNMNPIDQYVRFALQ
jgi:hypothetical protein